ncbi:cytochrome c-type biogenesis protein CcmH [Mesorhizobium sp. NBSH29]|uniref:cytochrome c-type biogenesis protein n=1 Tax=Mesorhizobium sp. NBSH29 TaxID=2654249 RepID=UPI0018967B78|nr:cytochrome c-type biogenesis protein [Mesorhizobium sp. NBSH29]QPC87229.1 cytochrome c-type biogenesis protein CcmH [Mesorhizobium sp. NBSH29]
MSIIQTMIAALLTLLLAGPALAVQPDEVLSNTALEQRARALSVELRCMVCQNQSIDDSDADLARDLRVLVRERLVAGDSDAAVLDFVVGRYGEFVLLRPRFNARNALLWAAPLLLLVGGGFFLLRRGSAPNQPAGVPLSKEEDARIAEILKGRQD